jgi:hypothetical protein
MSVSPMLGPAPATAASSNAARKRRGRPLLVRTYTDILREQAAKATYWRVSSPRPGTYLRLYSENTAIPSARGRHTAVDF